MASIVTALTKPPTKPARHRADGAQQPIKKHQNKRKDNKQRNSQTCWQFHSPAKPFDLHCPWLAGQPACRSGGGNDDRKQNQKLFKHDLSAIQFSALLNFNGSGKIVCHQPINRLIKCLTRLGGGQPDIKRWQIRSRPLTCSFDRAAKIL